MSKLTCLVCLRKFPKLEDDNISSYQPRLLSSPPTSSEENLYTRFLHFCKSHLKLTSLPLNGRENYEVFCPECKCLVSCLCDLWHEMEVVKLHLVWKLEKLGEMFKVLGKNSRAEKDLIKQLEMDSIRVRRFREEVKYSCERRRESHPKVVVSNRILPELWKFSYSKTKSTLVRLIIVFALGFDKEASNEESSTNLASNVKTEANDLRDAEEYSGGEGFNEFAADWSNAASPPGLNSDTEFTPAKPKRRRITRKMKIKSSQLMKWKQAVENIKCSMCPQSFRRSTTLVEHLKVAHSIKRPSFKCEICYKVFKTFYIMRRHIKSHDQALPHQDERLKTPSKASLPRQRRPKKFSIPAATCKICKENLYYFWNLETHMISEHETDEKSYFCWFCPERFSLKETRLAHRWNGRKHRHRKMFKCDFDNCQQYFQCPDKHEQHLQSHSAFKSDPDVKQEHSKTIHHCSKCNLGFFYEDHLVFHELNHLESEGEIFNCPKCPKSFGEKRLLLLHFKPGHLEDYVSRKVSSLEDRNFKCDKCDYLAYDEKGLKRHLKIHKEKEPLECETCGVICHGKMAKQIHLKNEHQLKVEEYPCPVCGRTYLRPGEVTKHMRHVHCGKRFFCDVCGAGFKHNCNLNDHKRTFHQAKRTEYICSSCGKAYLTAQGLRFHVNSVHVAEEEKGFGCPYCRKRFHREDLARKHVKTCMKQKGLEVPDDLDKIEVEWSAAALEEKLKTGRRSSKLISGRIVKENGDGKTFDKFLY